MAAIIIHTMTKSGRSLGHSQIERGLWVFSGLNDPGRFDENFARLKDYLFYQVKLFVRDK